MPDGALILALDGASIPAPDGALIPAPDGPLIAALDGVSGYVRTDYTQRLKMGHSKCSDFIL